MSVSHEPLKRPIQIIDRQAGHYVWLLENFLGARNIDRRIQQVNRESQREKGTYLRYWVRPNQAWWKGFEQARRMRATGKSFRGNVGEHLLKPIGTAAKIAHLYQGMPQSKRHELRQRLLFDKHLTPVLYEIDLLNTTIDVR